MKRNARVVLNAKRKEQIEALGKSGQFAKQVQIVNEIFENPEKYPEFAGISRFSLYFLVSKYSGVNKQHFSKEKSTQKYSRLPDATVQARLRAIEMVRAQGISGLYAIAGRLLGHPAFEKSKRLNGIAYWIKRHASKAVGTADNELAVEFSQNPEKKADEAKKDIPRRSEFLPVLHDELDFSEVPVPQMLEELKAWWDGTERILQESRQEVIRLRLEEVKSNEQHRQEMQMITQRLGEKEVTIMSLEMKCAELTELQAKLLAAEETMDCLQIEHRDPDEGLKYELKEKEEEITALKNKITWWEQRCEALKPSPLVIDAVRHMASSKF